MSLFYQRRSTQCALTVRELQHGSDVTEWKWGELPKTRNDEQAQKESKPLAKKTEEVKKEVSLINSSTCFLCVCTIHLSN